jgi:hypothetical protein
MFPFKMNQFRNNFNSGRNCVCRSLAYQCLCGNIDLPVQTRNFASLADERVQEEDIPAVDK